VRAVLTNPTIKARRSRFRFSSFMNLLLREDMSCWNLPVEGAVCKR
jgi:hypothetical protein